MKILFTSESVTEGHPDKICDQISDAILDCILTQDPNARVACEVLTSTGLVLITGEITTDCWANFGELARSVIQDIGYTESDLCFAHDTCSVMVAINGQSPDIAGGVNLALESRLNSSAASDEADRIGAGDQGMMFGYACSETPELMPLPISIAHLLAQRLTGVRKSGLLPYLRPDGKTQVTVEYVNGKPVRIDTIIISAQHNADITNERIHGDILTNVIEPVLRGTHVRCDQNTRYIINPSGRFVIGGPHGDAGLTGRKIMVDTYGGFARHGGGAFSGKDPTKVDRSAAYAARYVAKNVVASGLAQICELQVSYAIGMARPVSVSVFTGGTGIFPDETIANIIKQRFDLRPKAIIDKFNLRGLPRERGGRFYRDVASYGHFGRQDLDLPWESLDDAPMLQQNITELQMQTQH